MSPRHMLVTAAVFGALGVTLGAFGAHWLADAVQQWSLSAEEQARAIDVWRTAVRYHLIHAIALFGCGLLARSSNGKWCAVAAWLLTGGTVVFSGLLYALVLTGVKILGAIVPVGGVALIAGWIALAVAAWKQ